MSYSEQKQVCDLMVLEIAKNLDAGESREVCTQSCGCKIVEKDRNGNINIYKSDSGFLGFFRTLEATIRR